VTPISCGSKPFDIQTVWGFRLKRESMGAATNNADLWYAASTLDEDVDDQL